MAVLNAKNDVTKKVIHLMLTEKCNRNCPYCCNKQYDLGKIDVVSDEELRDAECIFLTGSEPFAFADPCGTARKLKKAFPNIKNVMVYTNALELMEYLMAHKLDSIDGLTISIKCGADRRAFESWISMDKDVLALKSNRIYVFKGFEDMECPPVFTTGKYGERKNNNDTSSDHHVPA